MKVSVHLGGLALSGMYLYDLVTQVGVEELRDVTAELEDAAFRLRRRIRACGRDRWPHGAGESWPLAEAIRLRAQLEALEHVLVVIRQLGCRAPAPRPVAPDVQQSPDLRSASEKVTGHDIRARPTQETSDS